MDIQSLRAGFFRGGGNVTALANCRHIMASCGKLLSHNQKIVYNFKQCFYSSYFLSLALDPYL